MIPVINETNKSPKKNMDKPKPKHTKLALGLDIVKIHSFDDSWFPKKAKLVNSLEFRETDMFHRSKSMLMDSNNISAHDDVGYEICEDSGLPKQLTEFLSPVVSIQEVGCGPSRCPNSPTAGLTSFLSNVITTTAPTGNYHMTEDDSVFCAETFRKDGWPEGTSMKSKIQKYDNYHRSINSPKLFKRSVINVTRELSRSKSAMMDNLFCRKTSGKDDNMVISPSKINPKLLHQRNSMHNRERTLSSITKLSTHNGRPGPGPQELTKTQSLDTSGMYPSSAAALINSELVKEKICNKSRTQNYGNNSKKTSVPGENIKTQIEDSVKKSFLETVPKATQPNLQKLCEKINKIKTLRGKNILTRSYSEAGSKNRDLEEKTKNCISSSLSKDDFVKYPKTRPTFGNFISNKNFGFENICRPRHCNDHNSINSNARRSVIEDEFLIRSKSLTYSGHENGSYSLRPSIHDLAQVEVHADDIYQGIEKYDAGSRKITPEIKLTYFNSIDKVRDKVGTIVSQRAKTKINKHSKSFISRTISLPQAPTIIEDDSEVEISNLRETKNKGKESFNHFDWDLERESPIYENAEHLKKQLNYTQRRFWPKIPNLGKISIFP